MNEEHKASQAAASATLGLPNPEVGAAAEEGERSQKKDRRPGSNPSAGHANPTEPQVPGLSEPIVKLPLKQEKVKKKEKKVVEPSSYGKTKLNQLKEQYKRKKGKDRVSSSGKREREFYDNDDVDADDGGDGGGRDADESAPSVEEVLKGLSPSKYDGVVKGGQWHVFEIGCWKPKSVNHVYNRIQKIVGLTKPNEAVRGLYSKIKWLVNHDEGFFPPARLEVLDPEKACESDILLCMKDVVLRVRQVPRYTITVEKHDPKWLFMDCFPFNYDPKAGCPVFEREMNEKLPDVKDQDLLLDVGATGLIPRCMGFGLLCRGESRSGKSTLVVWGIGSVFPKSAKESLKLHQINFESPYGTSVLPRLNGKLICIAPENDPTKVIDMTSYKQVCTGEIQVARKAFDRDVDVDTSATMIHIYNKLPKINGTLAEVNRLRGLAFSRVTPSDAIDLKIEKQVEGERAGIFNKLLERLPRLFELKGEFPHGGEASRELERQLKRKIDAIGYFIEEYATLDKNLRERSTWIDVCVREFLVVNNYETSYGTNLENSMVGFKKVLYEEKGLVPKQDRDPERPGKYASFIRGIQIRIDVKQRFTEEAKRSHMGI